MERFLQYLDDIDDLVGVLGLLYERIRIFALTLGVLILALCVAVGAMWLALVHPPVSLAIGTLRYSSATNSRVPMASDTGGCTSASHIAPAATQSASSRMLTVSARVRILS